MTFIYKISKSHLFSNSNGYHKIKIKVKDYAKNETEVFAFLSSDSIPIFNYSVNFSNDTSYIQFSNLNSHKPYFNIRSRYNSNYTQVANYQNIDNNQFIISNIESPLDVIEVYASNSMGIKSIPSFHRPIDDLQKKLTGKLSIEHYEHGIFIQFIESEMSGMKPYLTLEKNGIITKYNLFQKTPIKFISKIFSPFEIDEVVEINVYYENYTPNEIIKTNHWGKTILPDSIFNFQLINNEVLISGKKNTFNKPVHIWAKTKEVIPPKNGSLISKAYSVGPNLIPYNKEIELQISLSKSYFPEKISIFYYKQKDSSWHYMPSELNSDSSYIKTKILSGETFGIIKDTEPPILSSFIPEINGTYYSSDIVHLSFYIEDLMSGTNGETDVYMELDGKRVIFEYNSYQKKIRYPLKYSLNKGKHLLFVKAIDRVGNSSIIKGNFFIK